MAESVLMADSADLLLPWSVLSASRKNKTIHRLSVTVPWGTVLGADTFWRAESEAGGRQSEIGGRRSETGLTDTSPTVHPLSLDAEWGAPHWEGGRDRTR